jgi:hypothetical protein
VETKTKKERRKPMSEQTNEQSKEQSGKKPEGEKKKEETIRVKMEEKPKADVTPWYDKAAQTIAGSNQLLERVLKVVFSPVTLLIGGGLLAYWFFRVHTMKKERDKAIKEAEDLKTKLEGLEDDFRKQKKKNKRLKQLLPEEPESAAQGLGFLEQSRTLPPREPAKAYKTAFLD